MEIKNNELEEMRQQLGILKEKIDGQKLINDNLIRNSSKRWVLVVLSILKCWLQRILSTD